MQQNREKNAFGQPTQTTIYQHISNKIIKTESRFSVIPACSQKKCYRISRNSADVKATRRGARRNAPLRVRLRLRNRAFVR